MSTKAKNKPAPDHMITLWAPRPLVEAVDAHTRRKDTDRSKWIREAMREKAQREGILKA